MLLCTPGVKEPWGNDPWQLGSIFDKLNIDIVRVVLFGSGLIPYQFHFRGLARPHPEEGNPFFSSRSLATPERAPQWSFRTSAYIALETLCTLPRFLGQVHIMVYWAQLAVFAATPLLVLAAPSIEARQSVQKVTVNVAQKYQTMDGFGFSAAFQRANLVVNLKDPKQREVLDLLFNTTTGA